MHLLFDAPMRERRHLSPSDRPGTADPRDVRVVAKGGAIQITGQFVQGIVAFFFVAVAVRLLGADEYGLFRQVAQILAIAAQIGLVGFQYSALRSIAAARATGDPGEERGSAWTALVGSFIASAIVFLAIQILAGSIPFSRRRGQYLGSRRHEPLRERRDRSMGTSGAQLSWSEHPTHNPPVFSQQIPNISSGC